MHARRRASPMRLRSRKLGAASAGNGHRCQHCRYDGTPAHRGDYGQSRAPTVYFDPRPPPSAFADTALSDNWTLSNSPQVSLCNQSAPRPANRSPLHAVQNSLAIHSRRPCINSRSPVQTHSRFAAQSVSQAASVETPSAQSQIPPAAAPPAKAGSPARKKDRCSLRQSSPPNDAL